MYNLKYRRWPYVPVQSAIPKARAIPAAWLGSSFSGLFATMEHAISMMRRCDAASQFTVIPKDELKEAEIVASDESVRDRLKQQVESGLGIARSAEDGGQSTS